MSMPPLEEAVSVDEAGIWDAEAIAQVAAATFPLACPQDAAEDDIADFIERTLSAEKFAEYLSSPERIVLEARAGEEIVGYLMAVDAAPEDPAIDAMITARPAIEISKLYVMPGHHGSGISAALMDAIVARAHTLGRVGLWLGVNQENTRARRFYEKQGFEVVGRRTFVVGAQTHDDFVMQRTLRRDAGR
ncbi:GNAT family N-acetyltransferase [Rhodococcus pyridinivorans]|uniref:GNAT family N-acetyltransferase n=1 Tax=Rhodococcus pyridinivorans TaxID=103816 RepID=UPI001FFFAE60|nr:GNAT family N-acetyltransferase [Rhodococcus pyridinivorans]UPK64097.1 GNAT family N-acetyltransferase [Rhodococcus pyridinivorans]